MLDVAFQSKYMKLQSNVTKKGKKETNKTEEIAELLINVFFDHKKYSLLKDQLKAQNWKMLSLGYCRGHRVGRGDMIRKYTNVRGSKLSYFLSLMVDTWCSFYLNHTYMLVYILLHIWLYFRIKKSKMLNTFFNCTFHSTQCLLTPRRSWLYPEFKCSASPTLTSLCLGQMQALCVPDLHSQLLRQHLPLDIQKHLHFNLSEAELLIFSTLPPRGLPIAASGSSVHQPKIQAKILTLPCFFSSSLSSPLANPFDLIFEIVPESHHMSSPSLLPLKWRIVVSVNWSLFLRLPRPLKSVFKTVRMKLSKYKSDLVTHLLKTLAWHLLTHRLKPRFLPWPFVPPAQYGFWVSLCPHGIPLFTPPTLGSLLCFKTTGLPPPEGVCVCCSLCF
ncbi:uncharacterized protein LOC116648943 [Phoca vitulina]|uniref:uncharacterized protein LOC116648943 n=1 Tax=Phoca vitulina TaxID=9720 RepID=UPI001395F473|nr:uncharacterized protein LOC116648943 [Phoca vitulina]